MHIFQKVAKYTYWKRSRKLLRTCKESLTAKLFLAEKVTQSYLSIVTSYFCVVALQVCNNYDHKWPDLIKYVIFIS